MRKLLRYTTRSELVFELKRGPVLVYFFYRREAKKCKIKCPCFYIKIWFREVFKRDVRNIFIDVKHLWMRTEVLSCHHCILTEVSVLLQAVISSISMSKCLQPWGLLTLFKSRVWVFAFPGIKVFLLLLLLTFF